MSTYTQSQSPNILAPAWAHPDYVRRYPEWILIRDCVEGENAVKDKGTIYLPMMANMDVGEYDAYRQRATFFNMCNRTVTALVGTMFRRAPLIKHLPERMREKTKRISKDRQSLFTLCKSLGQQVVTVGRVGLLMDMPNAESKNPDPFFATYIAENICDWEEEEIDGRSEYIRVVLREYRISRSNFGEPRKFYPIYRVLTLNFGELPEDPNRSGWVYRQEIYDNGPDAEPDLSKGPTSVITPTIRGVSFNRIPFSVFGPYSTGIAIERSPLLDIAQINISHYRSYAQLEHGRFFTGLPVYYCAGMDGTSRGAYQLGPSVVWETGPGEKPGVIEFYGQGLKFLESALDQKEQHISTLGGRMLGVRSTAVAESDNMVKLKERNEQSLLLNVVTALSEGLTDLMYWWVLANDGTQDEAKKVELEINKDFLFDQSGAREFRAIHAMYMDGLIPVEVLFDYLKRADVIPDYMTLSEFTKQLENFKNFPGQPDAEARIVEGYPDSATKFNVQLTKEQMDVDQQIADATIEAQKQTAKVTAKANAEARTKQTPGS